MNYLEMYNVSRNIIRNFYYGNVGEKIINVNERLAEIDSTGHFEADDEVGTIFDTIKETVSELNEFISEEK